MLKISIDVDTNKIVKTETVQHKPLNIREEYVDMLPWDRPTLEDGKIIPYIKSKEYAAINDNAEEF